jgi:hypothetical protein
MPLDSQSPAVLLLSTFLGSAAVGFGLHRFGDAELRSWALPGAVAILCGGVGYTFYIPPVMTIAVFLAALYFLHRNARQRQEQAVASVGALCAGTNGPQFQKMRSAAPGTLGVWREAPKMVGASDALAEQREPMALTVQFVGEAEDEYRVVASARVDKFVSGVLFIHHAACEPKFKNTLADQAPLTGLEGQPSNLIFKAMPAEYVFGLLDIEMIARLVELFQLRKGDREIVLHASGPEVRLISNRGLDAAELKIALSRIALVAEKIRDLGGQERLF